MNILLTNDDGIMAPGLAKLVEAVKKIGQVYVVAPDREKSATGHGITVDRPLRAERTTLQGVTAWAVSGTPADCVKLAVHCLLEVRPDLVVSGINRGPNLGIDVLYSGTVAGALEAVILGIPALAVSVADYADPCYDSAASFISRLVPKYMKNRTKSDILLNINVPSLPSHEIQGVQITRLGARRYLNTFETRSDPRGRVYYWLGCDVEELESDPETDTFAVNSGKISITPIQIDLTDYRSLALLREIVFDFMGEQ